MPKLLLFCLFDSHWSDYKVVKNYISDFVEGNEYDITILSCNNLPGRFVQTFCRRIGIRGISVHGKDPLAAQNNILTSESLLKIFKEKRQFLQFVSFTVGVGIDPLSKDLQAVANFSKENSIRFFRIPEKGSTMCITCEQENIQDCCCNKDIRLKVKAEDEFSSGVELQSKHHARRIPSFEGQDGLITSLTQMKVDEARESREREKRHVKSVQEKGYVKLEILPTDDPSTVRTKRECNRMSYETRKAQYKMKKNKNCSNTSLSSLGSSSSGSSSKESSGSKKCIAKTKKGGTCKNYGINGSSYCGISSHNPSGKAVQSNKKKEKNPLIAKFKKRTKIPFADELRIYDE